MTLSVSTSFILCLSLASQVCTGTSAHQRSPIRETEVDSIHNVAREYSSNDEQTIALNDRRLENAADDDDTNLCEVYTLDFLTDTTDSKDVCQGLMNAYISADCGSVIEGKSEISYTYRDDDHDDYFSNRIGDISTCCHSLYNRYTGSCIESDFLSNTNLLVVTITLLLCECAKSIVKKYEIHFIPEAASCIMMGTILGIIGHQSGFFDIDELPFDDDLFLGVLLPPIIFEAALSVNKKEFRRRRLSIFTFAIFGTLMSSFTAGYLVHFASRLVGNEIPLLDSLIFGALISSIDPVAILSVLTSLNMCETDTIFILVFGESLLNDGIAITLFKSLVGRYKNNEDVDADHVLGAFADFLIVGFGSIVIGFLFGVLCLLYFWTLNRILHPVMEVGSFFLWAVIPYYICDAMEWSGIVAIVVMGFFMDIYIAAPKKNNIEKPTSRVSNLNFNVYNDDATNDNTTNASHIERGGSDFVAMQNPPGAHHNFIEDDTEIEVDYITRSLSIEPSFSFPEKDSDAGAPQFCDPADLCAQKPDELNLKDILFFKDRVRMSRQADKHVRFVAHLTASLAENFIFAYLGLFLLSRNYYWDFPLISIGVVAAILSRVLMVITACYFVWYFHVLRQFIFFPRFKPSTSNNKTTIFGSTVRVSQAVTSLQDPKTQVVLVLAGLRGAVSFALVENVPIYNAVTDEGSKYKAVMKAMTSASIIFTMFFFGGGSYYILKALDLETESSTTKQDAGDVELTSPTSIAKTKDTVKHNMVMLTADSGRKELFNSDRENANNHILT